MISIIDAKDRFFDNFGWHNTFYPIASDIPQPEGAGQSITFTAAATLYRITVDHAEATFPFVHMRTQD